MEPLAVRWAPTSEVSARPLAASGAIPQPALQSYNYFSGETSGETVNYSDVSSFTWWLELTKVCVEYIGAVCMDRNRVVTDRIVPGGGEGKILPGTRWELANAPGEYVGGCLTGDLVVSRPLNVLPRALIAIEVVGNDLETQRVYLGRLDSPPMNTKSRDPDNGEIVEAFKYHLVGPKAYASDSHLLGRVYEEQDVGAIFRDIVENHLAVKSPVIYNPDKIVDTGYTVAQQAFQNTKILSALDTLAQLAGEYVWGVDVTGEAYLAPRQASSDHHFWLDRHRVTLEKLDRDTDNIRNAIYVETPTESGGERIYYLLEDELSIEEWGRVEQVVAMPSSVVDLEDIMVTDVTSNKTIVDEANMYDGYTSGTYARMEGVVVDDYIDVHLNAEATITGFTFHQSSGLMAYYYSIREIEVQRLDGTFIARLSGLTPSTTVSVPAFTGTGFRLVVKEANTTGIWSIREISVTLGNLSDPAQYGASLLSLWKEPILVGTLAIDDGCFITPTGIRLTDALGTSYSFDVDQMTYELEDDGLHIKASVGKGQLNLARALALANTQISTVEESVRNSDTEGVTTEPIVDLSGLVTGGLNVGTGAEVYKATSDQEMQFRTLRSSDGSIGITQNEDDIDLAALGGGASSLAELDDVGEDAPLNGQSLVWFDDLQLWLPGDVDSGASSLDDLTDVDTTTTPPTDGQALVWDDTLAQWIPGDVAAGAGGGSVEAQTVKSTTAHVGTAVLVTTSFTELPFTAMLNETPKALEDGTFTISAGGRLVVNESGYYVMRGQVRLDTTSNITVEVYLEGAYTYGVGTGYAPSRTITTPVQSIRYLEAGQELYLQARTTSGSYNTTTFSNGTLLEITKLEDYVGAGSGGGDAALGTLEVVVPAGETVYIEDADVPRTGLLFFTTGGDEGGGRIGVYRSGSFNRLEGDDVDAVNRIIYQGTTYSAGATAERFYFFIEDNTEGARIAITSTTSYNRTFYFWAPFATDAISGGGGTTEIAEDVIEPASLTGTVAHWRSADLVDPAGGDFEWPDASGNGYDLLTMGFIYYKPLNRSKAAIKAILQSKSLGLPEHTGDFTFTIAVRAWKEITVYSQSSGGTACAGGGGNWFLGPNQSSVDNVNQAGVGLSVGTNCIIVGAHAASYAPPLVVAEYPVGDEITIITVKVSGNQPTLRVNGMEIKTGATATKTLERIDSIGFGAWGSLNGIIYDLYVNDTAMTDADMLEVEKAFAAEYGVEI